MMNLQLSQDLANSWYNIEMDLEKTFSISVGNLWDDVKRQNNKEIFECMSSDREGSQLPGAAYLVISKAKLFIIHDIGL
jgi:hypothetical protein